MQKPSSKNNTVKNQVLGNKKKVILGVSGGIACYKACEIVRILDKAGLDVEVVMTKHAKEFVTPLTFQALSKNPVRTELFNLTEESTMSHIEMADNADAILIAPATANFIAKAAHGICDDLLLTILCVTRAPVFIAPAMNVHMWENKIATENRNILKKSGYRFIGPAKGSLACGYEGEGRLEEPEIIANEVIQFLKKKNR